MLRLDMRGHGRTPVPAAYPWTIDALVDDLLAVVDAAALARFHLVGESIGGTAALAFAARHPQRVRSLTVSNGAHRGAGIRNLAPWREIIEHGGMSAWSAHMMQMRFFEGAIPGNLWQWYETQQARCDAATVLALADALAAADLSAELPAVAMPVLLMHPDASPFIPVAVMGELNEALPRSRLRVFAHARHGLPFSHAAECARELVAFIDEDEGVKS
jgi:pimeloyl-ACP methyl ester carboxylesterase